MLIRNLEIKTILCDYENNFITYRNLTKKNYAQTCHDDALDLAFYGNTFKHYNYLIPQQRKIYNF